MRRLPVLLLIAITWPEAAHAEGGSKVRAAMATTGRGLRAGAKGVVGGVLGAVGGIGGGLTGVGITAWTAARGRPQWLLSDRLSAKAMAAPEARFLLGKGQGQAGNFKKAVLNIAQFSVVGTSIGCRAGSLLTGWMLGETPCAGAG